MATESITYETLLDHLPDGVYLVDSDQIITYWNRGAERIIGYTREEVAGRPCTPELLAHSNEKGEPAFGGESPLALSIRDGATRESELFVSHKSGRRVPVFTRISPILNSRGEAIGALEVFSDNSSRMQAKQRIEELEEMALICPLTGVGNRRYAQMALQNAFEELRRYNWPFGLLFVDIDRFKDVNDTYGHAIGDEILCMVAYALRSSLRSFDFVGRWGGEEFVVILPNITDDLLRRIGERCRMLIEEAQYQHEGKEIRVTVSVGAVTADPQETPEQCLDRADKLMYQSKADGRNRVTVES